MYILLIITVLKIKSYSEDVIRCKELPKLVHYTKKIIDICRKNELEVGYCFTELFDNPYESGPLNELCVLIDNHNKINKMKIEVVPNSIFGYTVIIRAVHLRLWINMVDLCLKNEYIVTRIRFKRKIRKVLNHLRTEEWLNSDRDDMPLAFYVHSHSTIDKLTEDLFCLFNFIVS